MHIFKEMIKFRKRLLSSVRQLKWASHDLSNKKIRSLEFFIYVAILQSLLETLKSALRQNG